MANRIEYQAKRVDRNQPEIVKTFRGLGASVQILSEVGKGCPDLLIGIWGQNFLVEVKDGKKPPSAQKLTERQIEFHDSWKGHVCIVRTIDEAILFINSIQTK